jgi:hypothetical protein
MSTTKTVKQPKAPLTPFFKAALIGSVGVAVLTAAMNAIQGNVSGYPYFLILVVGLWISLKITQTAFAVFVAREFRTSTIFLCTLASGLLAGALAFLIKTVLIGIGFNVNLPDIFVETEVLVDPASYLALMLLQGAVMAFLSAWFLALLMRMEHRTSIAAWRPLINYWKPFYNGLYGLKLDPSVPAPAWYQDPNDPELMRYWDGQQWGDETNPYDVDQATQEKKDLEQPVKDADPKALPAASKARLTLFKAGAPPLETADDLFARSITEADKEAVDKAGLWMMVVFVGIMLAMVAGVVLLGILT